MRPCVVTGAWGGGTSAVAGIVAALGFEARPPLWKIDDPRTPNTWESGPWRDVLHALVDERTARPRSHDAAAHRRALEAFRDLYCRSSGTPALLKHPLAALLLDEIDQVMRPKFIFVFRPIAAIEATRARRGWADWLGPKGAGEVFGRMLSFYIAGKGEVLPVRYNDLIASPASIVADIARFTDKATPEGIAAAIASLRPLP